MPRLRELGITIGSLPTGPYNALTDVPGVLVGHATIVVDEPRTARTGVTVIVPRDGAVWRDNVFGGASSFNGNGEMTGLCWLDESGLISSPIAITNTHAVGIARDAIVAYSVQHDRIDTWSLPIAAETYDGWLSDIDAFHVRQEHVWAALDAAATNTRRKDEYTNEQLFVPVIRVNRFQVRAGLVACAHAASSHRDE